MKLVSITILLIVSSFFAGKVTSDHNHKQGWSDEELSSLLVNYTSVLVWKDHQPTIHIYNPFTEYEVSIECNYADPDDCGNVLYYFEN